MRKKSNCCGCGVCVDICPVKAIKMVQDKEGFLYPQINKRLCMGCGQCKEVCPFANPTIQKRNNLYLGARINDETIRYSSSSGGIFSLLARHILIQNGVVYGAAYNNKMQVIHMEVESLEQLEQIKRTKYVQSNMEGMYQRIRKRLTENRWVLFCGTPCQAQALINFLGKRYEKLIVVDLVCYGVPSPGIWNDYVKYLERKHDGKMTDFRFRDKRNRDNGQTCSYTVGGQDEVYSLYLDKYCMLYFTNLTIRPSCHHCRFSTVNRDSDFTIGDFWGIEHIRPDLSDGMGISMVILHTDKAKNFWNHVKKEMVWFRCARDDLNQPCLVRPTIAAKERSLFMIFYRLLPFSILMDFVGIMLEINRRIRS